MINLKTCLCVTKSQPQLYNLWNLNHISFHLQLIYWFSLMFVVEHCLWWSIFISISCFADLVKYYFCFTDAYVASVNNRNRIEIYVLMFNFCHIDFIVSAVKITVSYVIFIVVVCSASNAVKWLNLYLFFNIMFFTITIIIISKSKKQFNGPNGI